MKRKIEIDFKSAAFPVKALEPVTLDDVQYAPEEIFDARTQRIRDYLVERAKSAVDVSSADDKAVDVGAQVSDAQVGDAPTVLDDAPKKVDENERETEIPGTQSPPPASGSEQGSTTTRWRRGG